MNIIISCEYDYKLTCKNMACMPTSSHAVGSTTSSWRPWESPEELLQKPLSPSTSTRKRLFPQISTHSHTKGFNLAVIKARVELLHSKVLQARVLSLDSDLLPASNEGTKWLEVTRIHCEVRDGVGPIHHLRLVISSSQLYQVQVTWPVIRTSKFGVLKDNKDVDNLLDQLLPGSDMAVCPGIADYTTRYSSIRHRPKGLRSVSVGDKVMRYESVNCQLWYKRTDTRTTLLDRLSGVCAECKDLNRLLRKEERSSTALSLQMSAMRTYPSSNHPLSYLSPASQKVRIRCLMNERKALNIKLRKYDHLSTSLDDEQNNEMAAVVQAIDTDPTLRTELDQLCMEADEHCEGHGAILQEMWEADSAEMLEADFMEDQQRNSELVAWLCQEYIIQFS